MKCMDGLKRLRRDAILKLHGYDYKYKYACTPDS